ncbi:site-specific integrase [Polaribacter sp. MSW13]|uniref:Site-specific integrase n=1 Tax=Polaribacter marinus TaxID=2916838 RepID=A0A9X2ANI1_9FLAO|nr:site-specific integrase [Polaribacter marinus]MCI2229934.1 site-specific integrase [Polaribacter marinus]
MKHQELKELFQNYLSECEYSKQLRKATIKSYHDVFSTFQKIMPEIILVDDLYPLVMNLFFQRLKTRKKIVGKNTVRIGVKDSTIRTYYNKLIAFFRWLENHQYIPLNFTKQIAKPANPIYEDEQALSSYAVSKIIAAISLHTTDDVFAHKRDLLIISLFIYTGVRRGELLGLRVQDIHLENKVLFINGATSKSKRSRKIPLHPILLLQLKAYFLERKKRKITSDALIVSCKQDTALTHYGLKHWVNKYRKLSGVSFHVHQARHTFACSLAKLNADVTTIMKALGHSNLKTTQRYLRSINSEHSRAYIDQLSF